MYIGAYTPGCSPPCLPVCDMSCHHRESPGSYTIHHHVNCCIVPDTRVERCCTAWPVKYGRRCPDGVEGII